MNILIIGDVFGQTGIRAIEKELDKIKKHYKIDLTIANCENVTNCRGLNLVDFTKIKKLGVDFITMGNHTWKHDDINVVLKQKNIIRPYNVYGGKVNKDTKGWDIITVNNKKIKIINLLGHLQYFPIAKIKNPFVELENLLNNGENADITIVDFHAETTSEKNCMLQAFNSHVQVIVGTHTHVQTNDAHIYNNTAYITDLGMCGPSNGIIGAKKEQLIDMFFGLKTQFRLEEEVGEYQFCGVVIKIDDKTNQPIDIKNIYDYVYISKLIGDNDTLSEAYVAIYNEHKKDLRILKDLLIKVDNKLGLNGKERYYYQVFKKVAESSKKDDQIDNYQRFIKENYSGKHATLNEFNTFLSKLFKEESFKAAAETLPNYQYLVDKCNDKETYLLAKISDVSNSSIPHQLHLLLYQKKNMSFY